MKALDRPAPLRRTLLASEENLGKWAKAAPLADDLLTVSTSTEEVSCRPCPLERCGPAERFHSSFIVIGGSSTIWDQHSLGASVERLTGDLGLEGAADDVLRSSILDGDEVVSRSCRCVGHLVTFRTLLKVHLHFGRPINGHRESS